LLFRANALDLRSCLFDTLTIKAAGRNRLKSLAHFDSTTQGRIEMRQRTLASGALIIALLSATALAVTPRLHERVHKIDPHHECVVMLIASGQCQLTAVVPISVMPGRFLVTATPLSAPASVFPRTRISSVLEHAPPSFA
jgi:hypothetical protein